MKNFVRWLLFSLLFVIYFKANAQSENTLSYFLKTAQTNSPILNDYNTIIALMSLALGIGTSTQMHQPLAIAVIGGFIIALPLLLIVLPTLLSKVNFKSEENSEV